MANEIITQEQALEEISKQLSELGLTIKESRLEKDGYLHVEFNILQDYRRFQVPLNQPFEEFVQYVTHDIEREIEHHYEWKRRFFGGKL